MEKYDFAKIEKKWLEVWEKEGIYFPDIKNPKHKFYNLFMYPYPSAEGLHAGHAFASSGSDIYGRYMRMNGKDVFQPIGYDSFGMHSENYAIKIGEHPAVMLKRTTKHYENQLKMLGHGYDWRHTVTVSDIEYYKWTQWIFLQLFKAGLAVLKEANVNYCPSCKTVVSDEQVIEGKCERCESVVEKKKLKQWFFRITDYAQRLLNGHKKIKWSKRVIVAQKNWIGRSEGAEIPFKVWEKDMTVKVFTTRPDTLYGATFLVLSCDSPWVEKLRNDSNWDNVSKYIKEHLKKSSEEDSYSRDKSGVFTGSYVINPANGKKIPVYVSDYVVSSYGSGAIMGVPAHDGRDWEFAKKYDLEIIEVIKGGSVKKEAYEGDGEIVNSGSWDGKRYPEDIELVLSDMEKKGWGERKVNYHLRDWLISRQRYWGPPIPLIYCRKCASEKKSFFTGNKEMLRPDQSDWDHFGWYPEENLPVELPDLTDFKPSGEGKGPLADHPEFYKTKCPECGEEAIRETDVSDTFLDSSWYFLRYPSSDVDNSAFDPEITKTWLPVDLYFGGAEHSVLHLMYARFITMVLYDLDYLSFDEPFPHFFAHGLMIKDGAKMSKSKGNVVNPDEYVNKYGADVLRLYLMFMGPMDGSPDFRDSGMEGMERFVLKLWKLFNKKDEKISKEREKRLNISLNKTIQKVTEDIKEFKYNTAISAIMIFVNEISEILAKEDKNEKIASIEDKLSILCKLLAPFAPHMTEEVWRVLLKNTKSIHTAEWPKTNYDMLKEENVLIIVQINGKKRAEVFIENTKTDEKEYITDYILSNHTISKWIEGKKIVNTIYVKGRVINFVVS